MAQLVYRVSVMQNSSWAVAVGTETVQNIFVGLNEFRIVYVLNAHLSQHTCICVTCLSVISISNEISHIQV